MGTSTTRRWFARISGLAVLLITTHAAPAAAQTDAEFFDPQAVHEIRLFANSRDAALLREGFREDTYYPADFEWRGVRVRNVAIRSRGVGSRNPVKLGLRVDFDRYTAGQTFLGRRSLVLDNIWQDGSMIAERVAMAFFERMGQPSPRESYARVYLNHVYQGLYAVIEPVDTVFLTRAFGESEGHLFSYQLQRTWRAEYLGDALEPYKAFFEPETHELESAATLYGPIRDLFRDVNALEGEAWRERIGQLIDLPQFLRHVAIEIFLAEDDGFLGAFGMNNFFLYRSAGSQVHRFIPWDKDSAFLDSRYSIFNKSDENELFRRAISYPDLRALYLDLLEACARAAAEDGWLPAEVERMAAVADAPTREDTLKQFSTEAFEGAVEIIRRFAVERPAFVLEEVARARAASQ